MYINELISYNFVIQFWHVLNNEIETINTSP